MDQPVILSAVRTPIGKFLGGLASLSAVDWERKWWRKRLGVPALMRSRWTK